jgi:hypothetical protein
MNKNMKYEKLEDMAKDLYYLYNERSKNKYSKIQDLVAEIKKEAERLLLETNGFELDSLKAIIEDCDAIREILSSNKSRKSRKAKELLEIHVEDILIEARSLRGKTPELDPGYAPEENFIPDMYENENPFLEEASEFYEAEYGDY